MEEKLRQAILYGAEIMIESGMNDYKIMLHNKRSTLADCNVRLKVIRYSKHFIRIATKEQLKGVTLHEMAHGLAGRGHGHDAVFREKCRELGASKEYMGRRAEGITLPYRYNMTCPGCGGKNRANAKKKYICTECKNKGSIMYFEYEENLVPVVSW